MSEAEGEPRLGTIVALPLADHPVFLHQTESIFEDLVWDLLEGLLQVIGVCTMEILCCQCLLKYKYSIELVYIVWILVKKVSHIIWTDIWAKGDLRPYTENKLHQPFSTGVHQVLHFFHIVNYYLHLRELY